MLFHEAALFGVPQKFAFQILCQTYFFLSSLLV
jgi:hypothetical protein